MRERFRLLLATAVATVLVLTIWLLASVVVSNPKVLPPVWMVFTDSLASFSRFGSAETPTVAAGTAVILEHTGVTLGRIVVGTTLGVAAGIFTGLLLFSTQWLSGLGHVGVAVLRGIPLLALIPLFVFWFGGKEIGIHIWIAFACFVVMVTATVDAALNVPLNLTDLARLYGAGRLRVLFDVILPAIIPNLVTAYRVVMGLSWSFSLGAEYLVARSGLGYLASFSYMYADMGKLLFLVLYYGALGLGTHALTGRLYAILCPWHNDSSGDKLRQDV